MIATRGTSLKKESRLTKCKFDSKKRKYNSFVYAGIEIKKIGDAYLLNQSTHASKLQTLNLDSTCEEFRARRYGIAWLTHTRPDLCAYIAALLRVTAT